MANSNPKNNPIVITNKDGVKRTIQIFTLIGSNGELIDFTNNSIYTTQPGFVSEENSSTILLAADDTFFGSSIEILDNGIVFVNIYSDVASAENGLKIYQSSNGINWDHDDTYTVPAGVGKNYAINPFAKYLKIDYTNGSSQQGVFRLQTIIKANSLPSSHRIQDNISDDDDARLVKSILTAKFNGSGFGNISATASGNLRVTDAESGLAIASGDVVGTGFVHKFGNAKDFDTADGEVTIWDGAENGTPWELMNYVYSTTDDIDSISSTDLSDTQQISIQGLDSNWDLVTQTVTLQGQIRVALTTPLIRVFRAFNDDSTDLIGHVIIYVNGATIGGVPSNSSDIRAVIDPMNQQTLMAVYTIPNGKTGYMRDWYMATSGGNKSSNYAVRLVSRDFSKVFRTKHVSAMDALSPIPYHHQYTEPEIFAARTDIEMRVESIASPAALGNSVSGGFDIVLKDN